MAATLPFMEIRFQSFPSNQSRRRAPTILRHTQPSDEGDSHDYETEDRHCDGSLPGIGAGIANLFLDRGYNVVANSRNISRKNELQRSDKLVLVDGDIALAATAEKIVGTAVKRFGSIDALVNNAGIFFAKPFTEYTPEDFRALSSTNLDGFLHITQP